MGGRGLEVYGKGRRFGQTGRSRRRRAGPPAAAPAAARSLRSASPSPARMALQLPAGRVEVVIDHHVAEFAVMRHVADGIPQAPRDDRVGVRLAVAQALLQGGPGGRQDENGGAVRARTGAPGGRPASRSPGSRPGPPPAAPPRSPCRCRRSCRTPARVPGTPRASSRSWNCCWVTNQYSRPSCLRRPARAGGVRHGHRQRRVALQQRLHQGGLAGARGRRDHEQSTAAGPVSRSHDCFCCTPAL